MSFKNKSMAESLGHALDGLKEAFRTEINMKIHLIICLAVIMLGFILKLNLSEWSIVVIISIMVITAELFNTAIEIVVDMFCGNRYNEFAKKAKDTGAGAVLLVSLGAVIIGTLIFLPKIINILFNK